MLTDSFGSCVHAPIGHRYMMCSPAFTSWRYFETSCTLKLEKCRVHSLFRHHIRVQRLEERLSDTATVDGRAETCDDCLRELMTYLELQKEMVSMRLEDHDEVLHQWERHDQKYISSLNRHDVW